MPFRRERAAALERLGDGERLVVVDHDGHGVADAAAHGAGDAEILGKRRIAEPQLHGRKAAGEQLLGLVGGGLRRHQAEAAGIVGRDRSRRGAEHGGERHVGGDGERVPQRHVERRERHPHDAGDADQRKPPLQLRRVLDRRDALAGDQRDGIVQGGGDRGGAARAVAEQVAAAGDALRRREVDEEQRRLAHRRGAGAERKPHRHRHRNRADRLRR